MSRWAILLVVLGVAHGLNEDLPLPLSAPIPEPVEVSYVEESKCFTAKPEECMPPTDQCHCKRLERDNATVVCCHISSPFLLKEGLNCIDSGPSVRNLHIINATLPDLDKLYKLPLNSLRISNSHLTRLVPMPFWPDLHCLDLSENSFGDFNSDAFVHLKNLEFLSLANVNLTKLPKLEINVTLDLSGKIDLECSSLLEYLEDNPGLKFINENITFCFTNKNFYWFNSTLQVSLSQMHILHNIQKSCLPNCRCKARSFDMVAGAPTRMAVEVDCSNLGLKKLPDNLPANTIILNVSNNNISNLDLLGDAKHHKSYEDIREFYADSNQISSILALEGSKFIDNFLVLSLRNNKIKSLPTYILSNTFDRTVSQSGFRTLNLGFNRFSCNCSVAQVLKIWLLGNKRYIPDYDQIECDNMDEKVVELDVNKVCVYERDWTDYIYYIIAGEVGLLLLLVSKVSYDYWVFKTAGYLPWPASKMPKLPCDWVFE